MHRALGDVHRLAIVDALRLSDHTPSELAVHTGLGSNLVAFHLDVLEQAGLIDRIPSQGDGRRRYVRLHPDVLTALLPAPTLTVRDVLFVCTQNSARSQLAAALWQQRTGQPARSAGAEPATAVHPFAVAVAQTHGIDLSAARPQGYDEVGPTPDLIVSVCDRAHEAGLPFDVQTVHWSVPDPAEGDHRHFESAFDELAARVEVLAASCRAAA